MFYSVHNMSSRLVKHTGLEMKTQTLNQLWDSCPLAGHLAVAKLESYDASGESGLFVLVGRLPSDGELVGVGLEQDLERP